MNYSFSNFYFYKVIECEFKKMLDIPGVSLFINRIENDAKVSRETLSMMENKLEKMVAQILPEVSLDVVAFACTSASMVIGPEK